MTRNMLRSFIANREVARRQFTEEVIELQAGGDGRIALGAYREADPKPAFELIVEPADMKDVVGAPLERLDMSDTMYALYYQFHNYGHSLCRVTVRRVHNKVEQ